MQWDLQVTQVNEKVQYFLHSKGSWCPLQISLCKLLTILLHILR